VVLADPPGNREDRDPLRRFRVAREGR